MNDIDKVKEFLNPYDTLPNIDKQTGKIVNYIFERLAGIVPSMSYSSENSMSIDSIKREYTYALIQKKINGLETINKALERIRDDRVKFIPSPGDFVNYCIHNPQKSTVDYEFKNKFALESNEHKEEIYKKGKKHISDLLGFLKK